jgi:hypothetical protein
LAPNTKPIDAKAPLSCVDGALAAKVKVCKAEKDCTHAVVPVARLDATTVVELSKVRPIST